MYFDGAEITLDFKDIVETWYCLGFIRRPGTETSCAENMEIFVSITDTFPPHFVNISMQRKLDSCFLQMPEELQVFHFILRRRYGMVKNRDAKNPLIGCEVPLFACGIQLCIRPVNRVRDGLRVNTGPFTVELVDFSFCQPMSSPARN